MLREEKKFSGITSKKFNMRTMLTKMCLLVRALDILVPTSKTSLILLFLTQSKTVKQLDRRRQSNHILFSIRSKKGDY